MFEQADDLLGIDLRKVCLEGPEETLVQTRYTQPALYVHSSIADRYLAENGLRPSCGGGHSLGEITALAAAGVISFEDGLRIVSVRSQSMQIDCDNNPGTMAAVIGLEMEKVLEICESIEGLVQPANYNSPSQIAVSGDLAAVDRFTEKAKAAGARKVIKLAVGGAYHSPLMESTQKRLAEICENIKFKQPLFPVVSNVTGRFYEPDRSPAEYLVEQIQAPVLWYPSMEFLYEQGVTTYIEVGPGNVLQGLIKRSLNGVRSGSFERPGQLDTIRELFKIRTE